MTALVFSCEILDFDAPALGFDFGCQSSSTWWLPYIRLHVGWWSLRLGWFLEDVELAEWTDSDE